jgi:hypothetical protein
LGLVVKANIESVVLVVIFFFENAQESYAPLYIKKIGKRSKIDQTTAGLLTGARK